MTNVIQYYGTGRRKEAIARVRLVPGTGKVVVNQRTLEDYFGGRVGLKEFLVRPLDVTESLNRFDALITVHGGGVNGQAHAIRHGISRALAEAAPQNRAMLRNEGMLTRDSRIKERKKYGRKKARKRFQFSKR